MKGEGGIVVQYYAGCHL